MKEPVVHLLRCEPDDEGPAALMPTQHVFLDEYVDRFSNRSDASAEILSEDWLWRKLIPRPPNPAHEPVDNGPTNFTVQGQFIAHAQSVGQMRSFNN